MIPVPIGHHRGVLLTQRVPKHVVCEACQQEFVYIAVRRAQGSALSPLDLADKVADKMAEAQARRQLQRLLDEPDMVACPGCGWYQTDMIRHFQKKGVQTARSMYLTTAGVVLGLSCSAIVLARAMHFMAFGVPVAAAALVVAGGVLLTRRWKSNSDPNRSATPEEIQARIASTPATTVAEYRQSLAPAPAVAVAPEPSMGGESDGLNFEFLYAPEEPSPKLKPQLQLRKQENAFAALEEAERNFIRGVTKAIVVGGSVGFVLDAFILSKNNEVYFVLGILDALLGAACVVMVDTMLLKNFQNWVEWVRVFSLGLPTSHELALPRSWIWVGRAACLMVAMVAPMMAIAADPTLPSSVLVIAACQGAAVAALRQLRQRSDAKRRRRPRRS